MTSTADLVIDLYEHNALDWDQRRGSNLVQERAWIERLVRLIPVGGSILDLGCGSGQPIAGYLIERGFAVTGIDSAPALISLCRSRFPEHEWHVADMRTINLGKTFAAILAWDSFFHLTRDAQRAMFTVFSRHAAPGAALLFTSGPGDGESIGTLWDRPLYHASLAPEEYRSLLDAHGFVVQCHRSEDPECGGHTVWLASRDAAAR